MSRMDDIIWRTSLLNAISLIGTECHIEEVIELIKTAPSVDIDKVPNCAQCEREPIVCCKECKWWNPSKVAITGKCAIGKFYCTGDFFCKNGSKK